MAIPVGAPTAEPEAESPPAGDVLLPATAAFYRAMMAALQAAGVPFLVGGAYALTHYTGIERHTKDFDVFVRPRDAEWALAVLADAGCATDLTFPHWLGKAYAGADFIDVIFASGNGLATVDDAWFAHAVATEVLGRPARVIPPEEMVWVKAFIMERERFDGADINHLLRALGADLDWPRLLRRFGAHWRVLLAHLVLFGYVYPAEAGQIPYRVMHELLGRAETEVDVPAVAPPACRGPFLSRAQYLIDIAGWGYADARLEANGGAMTDAEIREWTEAIGTIP